jgi:hypothetical protein
MAWGKDLTLFQAIGACPGWPAGHHGAMKNIYSLRDERVVTSQFMLPRTVTLTSIPHGEPVNVGISEMIAYSQQLEFTRLNLTRCRTLDVKETTDEIDRLMRRASAQSGIPVLVS